MYNIDRIIQIIHNIGLDEENFEKWDKSHFVSQVKGDNARPSRCPRCEGKLNEIDTDWWEGWICKDCQNIVYGISFYQGRNNMKAEIIKQLKLIK